jgi:hypothetical protein
MNSFASKKEPIREWKRFQLKLFYFDGRRNLWTAGPYAVNAVRQDKKPFFFHSKMSYNAHSSGQCC